jgi:hypothetical protein
LSLKSILPYFSISVNRKVWSITMMTKTDYSDGKSVWRIASSVMRSAFSTPHPFPLSQGARDVAWLRLPRPPSADSLAVTPSPFSSPTLGRGILFAESRSISRRSISTAGGSRYGRVLQYPLVSVSPCPQVIIGWGWYEGY